MSSPDLYGIDELSGLSGSMPPAPAWGQERVAVGPELRRRVKPDPASKNEVAVVLGAGGALGPDFVNALLLRGHAAVVGVDIALTYVCKGAGYRKVDLCDRNEVLGFYRDLRVWAKQRGLRVGATYDLSTVQTSPVAETGVVRGALEDSKDYLIEALCQGAGDVRYFYMSSGEVYGASPGAPYKEAHDKQPFNHYARAKWHEEQKVLSRHRQAIQGGALHVSSLRTWTISMVSCDEDGAILSARNYNDPLIIMAQHLASAGVRPALIDPDVLCQFHFGEEVAEVAVLMTNQPLASPVWGAAFNCLAQPATARELMDVAFGIFTDGPRAPRPWWAPAAGILVGHARLPKSLVVGAAYALQCLGGLLGARDLGGRLPFLYRDTHMDDSAIKKTLEGQLTVAQGSTTMDAVGRLARGLQKAGSESLAIRRYRSY